MNIKLQLNNFYNKYPFLNFNNLIDNFLLFGGSEEYIELDFHIKKPQELLIDLIDRDFSQYLPFFILEEPFKSFLITIAKGDAKIDSALKKSHLSLSLKDDVLNELIENNIIFLEYSREPNLREYPKQKIKREFKYYTIQNKLRFNKPIYHLFFFFIAPYIDKKINKELILKKFEQDSNRLKSLYFEYLSIELLKNSFKNITECYSYWDKYSEFDIFCRVGEKFLIGECKYTSKPLTKFELLKLKDKIEKSNLKNDYIVLFSKSGFSKEFEKIKDKNLFLFSLTDFNKLLE